MFLALTLQQQQHKYAFGLLQEHGGLLALSEARWLSDKNQPHPMVTVPAWESVVPMHLYSSNWPLHACPINPTSMGLACIGDVLLCGTNASA
jgi:hypothetical protein